MNVLELFAKLILDSSEYEKELDKAKGKADSVGSKIGKGLKTAAKIGAAALGAATTAATGFAVSAVKAGQSFDSSMSQVAATMGKSMDEVEKEVGSVDTAFGNFSGNLREYAQFMGANTAFSASEAADALNYMALAGYDVQTSMDMLPNVLNLAAAGGMDLATASDMVTDAQSALGLSIEETSEMVDKMAKASSKSNTSVAQLGEAFLTIGATARNLKGGTTELSTVLGVLADNGIKGAEGGTHLRNILLSLQTPTKDGIAALAELGLTYEDMYDEAGNMRGLDEIMLDLQQRMEGMTQASKDAITSGIFNKTDLAAVNALIGTSADRYDELTKSIDDSNGAAQKMADTQLDNLAGDVTKFKSALEGIQITLSDELTPSLRKFTQFGTSGLSKLTEAFKEGGLSGAMGAFGEILSNGLSMIIDMLPELISAGAELLDALVKGILENIPKLADAALTIIKDISSYLIENIPELGKAATDIITELAGFLSENLPELISTAVDMIITLVDTLTNPDNLSNMIDAAIEIILALIEGLVEALPKLIEYIPQISLNIMKALIKSAPMILKAAVELVGRLIQGIVESSGAVISTALDLVGDFVKGIGEGFVKIFSIGSEMIDEVKNGIAEKIEQAKQWGKDLIDNFVGGIKDKIGAVKEVVTSVADKIKGFLGFSEPDEGPLSNFHTYAPDMMQLFAKGIKDNENLITNQIAKSFDFGDMIGENVNVTANGEKTVRHTGTIRLEGVNNEGEFVAASEYAIEDIVVNIMKRQARLA